MMVIGVTDSMRGDEEFNSYASWVRAHLPDAVIRRLSADGRPVSMNGCDAIVLTGGGDIQPGLYGKQVEPGILKEVKPERDRFEMVVARRAIDEGLPILGICRGMQLVNVALGGSLIPDLELSGRPSHRKGPTGYTVHPVELAGNSVLSSIVGRSAGEVNTFHHQAVDRAGEGLEIVARSPDGVPEAAEWKDKARRPFLALVQWHPERVRDPADPFSRNIIARFGEEARRIAEVHASQVTTVSPTSS